MIQTILYRIRRNPVLVGAALLWGFETATTGDPLTWQGVVALVVGVIVRSKVIPVNEVVLTDSLNAMVKEMAEALESIKNGEDVAEPDFEGKKA